MGVLYRAMQTLQKVKFVIDKYPNGVYNTNTLMGYINGINGGKVS